MKRNNIHKLDSFEIYQLAKKLAVYIYGITKEFPKDEKFGLTSQIRRCVSSIGANIAEGYGRYHYKDEVRFDHIARGSLFELHFHIELAREFGYISTTELDEVLRMGRNLGIKLNNYISYLRNKS
ncbi:four helix bundle protein [Patescibacteria group bacterium]